MDQPTRRAAAAIAVLAVTLGLRLYALDRLPAEIYGDIVIIYEQLFEVLDGRWILRFSASNGPLYQYLIAPLVLVIGPSYLGLKLASVAVSLGVIAATYALGHELDGPGLGLTAALFAGTSSWLLIFSRLGNSQILVPLLATLSALLALRAARSGRSLAIVLCALVSALGLYLYPQSFILPGIALLMLVALQLLGPGLNLRPLLLFGGVTLLAAIPFALIVARDPANFSTGYIGEKAPELGTLPTLLAENLRRGLLSLHVRGDQVFRSNPARLPHLDPISGALVLLGLAYWLEPTRWRVGLPLLLPLLLLPLPSLLVRYPEQVPSASRMLGIVPFLMILCASGLLWIWRATSRLRPAVAALALLALTVMALINAERYFVVYQRGLPNQNLSFGTVIAQYIDGLDDEVQVYVAGCCWGEWSQPHPKGIEYALTQPRRLSFLASDKPLCPQLAEASAPWALIADPGDKTLESTLRACVGRGAAWAYSARGTPVFQVFWVPPEPCRPAAPGP